MLSFYFYAPQFFPYMLVQENGKQRNFLFYVLSYMVQSFPKDTDVPFLYMAGNSPQVN